MSATLGVRGECAVPLASGTLVIASPAAFGAGAVRAVLTTPSWRRLLAGNPDAMARLRGGWVGLRLPGDPGRLTAAEVLDRLDAAIASGRLAAAFFPRPLDRFDRVELAALPVAAAPPSAVKPVRDMARAERVEAALRRVPDHLSGPLKEAFASLLSRTSIAITVGAFAALATAQFFGYGEVADVALAGIAYAMAGLAGVRALYDMVAGTVDAATAGSDAEIDAAAARLAAAFVVLGMAFLTVFVARSTRRSARSKPASGQIVWPPNRGFLGIPIKEELPVGARVDRYGFEGGTFVSPEGTPIPSRSLAPGTTSKPYNVYEVTKPVEVESGPTAPWFGQPGLGTQYELPMPVGEAISQGYLKRVGP